MSAAAIADLVERSEAEAEADEAAIAEGETPAPEPEPEPAPVPEPEPAPEPAALDSEKTDKALKTEDTRHVNVLKKIYGEKFAERIRCGICDGEGHVEAGPGLLHTLAEAGEQAQLQLGTAWSTLLSPDNYVMCEYCGGEGAVRTKAKTDTTASVPCKKCDARGYFDTDDPIHRAKLGLAPPEPVAPVVQFPTFHQAPSAQVIEQPFTPPTNWHASGKPGADTWDRWPGHPRYGIDPANGGW